jgi:APA family basic amino acid/polyamine antiporter
MSVWHVFWEKAGRRRKVSKVESTKLVRCLGFWDLVSFGVGNSLGAGLFVTIGPAAVKYAGPGVALSFLLGAIAALLTALCYAQLATVPGVGSESGSAYMYVYATVGEFAGFVAGWLVSLGYVIGAAAVARGWVDYAQHLAHALHFWQFEAFLAPVTIMGHQIFQSAAALCAILAGIVLLGVRDSTNFNNLVTFCNISVILAIIVIGAREVDPQNWEPFLPYGWTGVVQGAGVVFFAFLGFDASTALGGETVDPEKTMPRALIAIVAIVAILYVVVALTLTGMLPLNQIHQEAPLAHAFTEKGSPTVALFVGAGAVGMTVANTFCAILTQPRIWLCMAEHGLLPGWLAEVSPPPRSVPTAGVLIMAALVMLLASSLELSILLGVTSLSCLVVFVGVAAGLLLYHCATEEDRSRCWKAISAFYLLGIAHGFLMLNGGAFQLWLPLTIALAVAAFAIARIDYVQKDALFVLPGTYVVPLLAILANSYMTAAMGVTLCLHFLAWLIPGVLIYLLYGQYNSELNGAKAAERMSLVAEEADKRA